MQIQTILTGAIALTLLANTPAQRPHYDAIYVFGDSLSDNGNLFKYTGTPAKPYWEGRFSNGRVCAEQLAAALHIAPHRLRDFALGGATTSDVLQRQVQPALVAASGKLPSNTLCFYWAGANDLLNLLSKPGDPTVVITNAMQQTAASVVSLHFAGAAKIIVVNMPDLSKTPRVVALNDPTTSAGVAALAQAYNGALAGTMAQIAAAYKIDITVVDAFALIRDIVANPARRMFRIVDKPILQPDDTTKKPASHYLFFDGIHPSFTGHREIMRTTLLAMGIAIPGDVNGDELVNRDDIPALARAFGPCRLGCPADLNHDGGIDPRDMEVLLRMLQGQ